MPEKKGKIQKIDEAFDKADKVTDAIEAFTPPVIDGHIEQGKQIGKFGWGIFKAIKEMFPKKKK